MLKLVLKEDRALRGEACLLCVHVLKPEFCPQSLRAGCGGHTFNPSTRRMEAEEPEVHGYPWIHSEVQASLGT